MDSANGSASGPGSTWGTAYDDLQTAIDAAPSGAVILVAEGVYHPPTAGLTDPREGAFTISKQLDLHGGFKGLSVTNPSTNPHAPDGSPYNTVLTGDPGTPADISDDAYNVVRVDGTTISIDDLVLLDGFRIEYGYANGAAAPFDRGAGVHISGANVRLENATVQECKASTNGGGVYGTDANLSSRWTRFKNNTAEVYGGGVCLDGVLTVDSDRPWLNSRLHNTFFDRNLAWSHGGGFALLSGAPLQADSVELANCVVRDNYANSNGGGIFLVLDPVEDATGAVNLANCTVAYNSVANGWGGGLYSSGSNIDSVNLSNSLLWANRRLATAQTDNVFMGGGGHIAAQYSLIGPSIQANNLGSLPTNLNVDPDFQNGPAGDYRLQATSVCLEAGSDFLIPLDRLDLDDDGDLTERIPRDFKMIVSGGGPSLRQQAFPIPTPPGLDDPTILGIVDMGAYETAAPQQ